MRKNSKNHVVRSKADNKNNRANNKYRTLFFVTLVILVIFLAVEAYIEIKNNVKINDNKELTKKYYLDGILRLYPNQDVKVECMNNNIDLRTRINEEGHRGRLTSENMTNIGIFGDSFVYGDCIADNETSPAQLQKKLDEKYSQRFNVVNYGLPGYNLKSMLIALDEATLKNNIKYSIIFFNPEDDLMVYDVSERRRLNIYDNKKSEYVESHIKDLFKENYKIRNITSALEKVIRTYLIEKKLDKRTEIVFFISVKSEQTEQILKKYNITYIIPDELRLMEKDRSYFIPYDGHPNFRYNDEITDVFFRYIQMKETNQE